MITRQDSPRWACSSFVGPLLAPPSPAPPCFGGDYFRAFHGRKQAGNKQTENMDIEVMDFIGKELLNQTKRVSKALTDSERVSKALIKLSLLGKTAAAGLWCSCWPVRML